MYGLIKVTSRIMRNDTIIDLRTVNNWRASKGLGAVSPGGPSLRKLENAVALGLKDIDCSDCPKLERGKEFYISIQKEI